MAACTLKVEACASLLKPWAKTIMSLCWKDYSPEEMVKQFQGLLRGFGKHTKRLTTTVLEKAMDDISLEMHASDCRKFAQCMKDTLKYCLQKNRDASTGAKMSTPVRSVLSAILSGQARVKARSVRKEPQLSPEEMESSCSKLQKSASMKKSESMDSMAEVLDSSGESGDELERQSLLAAFGLAL